MDRNRKDPPNTGNPRLRGGMQGTGDFADDANDSNDIPDRDIVRKRAATERDDPRSLGDVWQEHGEERGIAGDVAKGDLQDRRVDRTDLTGLTDRPDPIDPTGSEWENGPGVDVDDPNLSQVMAEAGAEDRRDELGKLDEADDPDTMRLDDPEAEENEEGEDETNGGDGIGDDGPNGAGRRP